MQLDTLPLEERLIAALSAFFRQRTVEITPATTLREDMGLDSIDLAHLELLLEHTFNVRVTTTDIAVARTVGDLVSLIRSKKTL